jgi:hypothetical protein
MFHDSNSADPSGPIVKPTDPSEGNGGGQPTDPPPTTTERKVTNFSVSGNPGVGYEGQKPLSTSFADLTIEVWYDDARYETLSGTSAITGAGFVTVPAVLWASSTNTVSGSYAPVTQAAFTPITIYHAATGIAVNQSVTLPGVRAIDTTYSSGDYVSGTALISGSVEYFYEDDVAPDLSGVRVSAVYQQLAGNGYNLTTTGAASAMTFSLDANYIFTDYWNGFPTAAKTGATRYEFGVDTTDKSSGGEATVYALISRAPTDAQHTQAGSLSKYVKVPLKKLYNINHIPDATLEYTLKAKGLENDGLGYWYSDDTRFLGRNASLSTTGVVTPGTNNGLNNVINDIDSPPGKSGREYWKDVIENSKISFEVHYMGVTDTETKLRDTDFLKRAFVFGNAQVESVPDFRLYEDNPDAVTLLLGYFGWDKLQANNTPNGEYWLNYITFKIPIARFTETIRFERPDKTVKPIEIDSRSETGNTISQKLLNSIMATYILQGIYTDPDGKEVYREVPQKLWNLSWFGTGDLRNYNEDVAGPVDLEVTIRTSPALLGAGFAAYVGLEPIEPITIWAIP